MKKAILSLLILISFSAFSQNVVIFQNGNTQPMQFITDSLKTRVDSCSAAIQSGGSGGGVTTGTPNAVRYFNAAGRDTSNAYLNYDGNLFRIGGINSPFDIVVGNYFNSGGQNGIYSSNGDEILADFNSTTNTYRYANGAIKSTPTAALDVTGAVKLNSLLNTPNPANKMMVLDTVTKGVAYVDIPASGGVTKPLVYTATLNQNGTNDPVANVIGDNTVGNILWSRVTPGIYRGILTGAFTNQSKIIVFVSISDPDTKVLYTWEDGNTIQINTYRESSTSYVDDILNFIPIKIEVYQ